MNEFQISVSMFGKFMFRTDWDDCQERVENVYHNLVRAFPSAKIQVMEKSKLSTVVDWSVKL